MTPPTATRSVGRTALYDTIRRFDAAADAALERVRGRAVVDKVMTAATHAGEFSLAWHAAGLLRGAVTGRWDQTLALAAGLGAESLIVNQGLKRVFRRTRPTTAGDERYTIRAPLTSSFPSGHASAATFAAFTLVRWDGPASLALWGTIAATIALSRPYVRIHHASDIVGGVATGAVLAALAHQVYAALGVG